MIIGDFGGVTCENGMATELIDLAGTVAMELQRNRDEMAKKLREQVHSLSAFDSRNECNPDIL